MTDMGQPEFVSTSFHVLYKCSSLGGNLWEGGEGNMSLV